MKPTAIEVLPTMFDIQGPAAITASSLVSYCAVGGKNVKAADVLLATRGSIFYPELAALKSAKRMDP